MVLIVGLGNPGRRYVRSRHNVGWMVLDGLAGRLSAGHWQRKNGVEIFDWKPRVKLVKPMGFMNRSGPPVERLRRKMGADFSDLWVIHDDLDLDLGKIKIVRQRGSAGHRGLVSLFEALGTNDFYRFRLGIGRPSFGRGILGGKRLSNLFGGDRVKDFVLAGFSSREEDDRRQMIERTADLIEQSLEEGIDRIRRQGAR